MHQNLQILASYFKHLLGQSRQTPIMGSGERGSPQIRHYNRLHCKITGLAPSPLLVHSSLLLLLLLHGKWKRIAAAAHQLCPEYRAVPVRVSKLSTTLCRGHRPRIVVSRRKQLIPASTTDIDDDKVRYKFIAARHRRTDAAAPGLSLIHI